MNSTVAVADREGVSGSGNFNSRSVPRIVVLRPDFDAFGLGGAMVMASEERLDVIDELGRAMREARARGDEKAALHIGAAQQLALYAGVEMRDQREEEARLDEERARPQWSV